MGDPQSTLGATGGAAEPDAPLAPGARVGRYVVVARIGAGAMGTVYAARDTSLDRDVALKLLRGRADDRDEARLLREAKAMARLACPDVITVFEAGREGDRLFLAMELVDGGTLRAWCAGRPWREVLTAYARAGRGLAAAHAAGLVHRDFKPDNVLVGRDGRVRVTDFGLAVDLDAAPPTQSGALGGTPAYMAPEQLAHVATDARTDVYGFCVALYEALYGERPFAGETIAELASAKIAGRVRPPPAGSPVPPRVRRALLAGLRARPEERYASMTALLDALDRATRPPRAALAAGGAIAIAIGAAIAWGARPRPSPAPPPAATPIACTGTRACTALHGGEPHACRASDGACVPLASADCVARFEPEDLASDDTIWLGAMFPRTGPAAAAYGEMNLAGADFARVEIARATRALRGAGPSSRARPIALVACDDATDAMRAAHHLVDDVGVPAILGFGSGKRVIEVAGSFLIDRGVVTVSSISPSPMITRLPQPAGLPPMVWRTTFGLDDVARATARVVREVIEPRAAARPTRVVLMRDASASSLSFGEALYGALVFNGKTTLENGRDYAQITFAPGALDPATAAALGDRLADAAPTIAVLLGSDDAGLAAILARAESRWRGGPRPTYLLGNATLRGFKGYLGASVDRRRRLFGIIAQSPPTAGGRFVLRYNDAHEEKVALTRNPASSYDAFYLLAYAAFALRDERVTGPGLARAFGRLVPPGPEIEVGPSHVLEAIKLLSGGSSIDLRGAGGDLDFDPANGEAPADFALVCADADARGAASGEDLESGVVVRARTGRIEGTMRCP